MSLDDHATNFKPSPTTKIFLLFLVTSTLVAVTNATGSEIVSCNLPLRRLPTRVRPSHYQLHVEPSLESLAFSGIVKMNLEVNSEPGNDLFHLAPPKNSNSTSAPKIAKNRLKSNVIIFHADRNLTIHRDNMTLVLLKDERIIKSMEIVRVCRDKRYQLVVVHLGQDLLAPNNSSSINRAQLSVSFSGQLRDDMFGFYKSSYFSDDTKQKHYLATTQFESTDARKAFPCFDEPHFKATFELTMVHEPKLVALSNTEVVKEEVLEDGRTLVRFAKTPPMSTYLLAFTVGEFEFIERVILNGRLKVRIYTTPGKSQQGEFAMNTACRSLVIMENYFGIEFPLNKMDLVGIPDFEADAMENWGLITFREVMLLVDETDTSPMGIEETAEVVVHELAHQWFGNLVTMRWWNDLWLNEGFATWMAYHILEQVHPQFNAQKTFLLNIHLKALDNDAQRYTHAIRSRKEIETNDQIADLFDLVTYEKSASVLRFIHNDYLGPELFKESLRHYMAKHKYGNTETDDLCASMEEVSRLPVKPILDSWVEQEGHPVLKVGYDMESNTLLLVQERFVVDLGDEPADEVELDRRWIVPVSVLVVDGDDAKRRELLKITLNDTSALVKLPDWFPDTNEAWLKLNHQFSGFYRVQYPPELLQRLERPIRERTMSAEDRLNIINDAHSLWLANYITSLEYIELLNWFKNDRDGLVLSGLASNAKDLLQLAKWTDKSTDFLLKLQAYLGQLLEGHLNEPFFNATSETTTIFGRLEELGLSKVLRVLVSMNHNEATAVALKMYNSDVNKIKVALRMSVYLAVARWGSEDQFDHLLELLRQTRSRNERNRLAQSLANTHLATRQKKLNQFLASNYQDMKVDFSLAQIEATMSGQLEEHKASLVEQNKADAA